MKRILCILLCAAALFAGCDDSSRGPSESQLYEMEFDTSKYDSHIVFQVDGTKSEKELTEVSKQLEQRLERCFADKNDDHPSITHQTQTDHGAKTVTIYFNNKSELSPQFLEFVAAPNKVELKKGDKADGEVVLDSDAFYDAFVSKDAKTSGGVQLGVELKLSNKGREKYNAAVKRIKDPNEQFTVWLDGKALITQKASETVKNGKIVITGADTADEQSAWELAYRLRSGYIEYKVTIKENAIKEKAQAA